ETISLEYTSDESRITKMPKEISSKESADELLSQINRAFHRDQLHLKLRAGWVEVFRQNTKLATVRLADLDPERIFVRRDTSNFQQIGRPYEIVLLCSNDESKIKTYSAVKPATRKLHLGLFSNTDDASDIASKFRSLIELNGGRTKPLPDDWSSTKAAVQFIQRKLQNRCDEEMLSHKVEVQISGSDLQIKYGSLHEFTLKLDQVPLTRIQFGGTPLEGVVRISGRGIQTYPETDSVSLLVLSDQDAEAVAKALLWLKKRVL
ncbi:MAG: hypothetical protein ACK4UN_00335, partial [Limisphaerales bacterium]